MTQLDRSSLMFENGLWNCQIVRAEKNLRLDIKGNDHFFDNEENVALLNDFVGKLAGLEAAACRFA